MSESMFRKESRWQHGTVVPLPPRPSPRQAAIPLLSGLAIVVVVSLIVGVFVRRQEQTAAAIAPTPSPPTVLPTWAPAVVAPTMMPQPTPVPCVQGATYLDAISLQEKQGNWAAAASTANLASRIPNLCTAADRHALQQKAVTSGLEALFATPLPPYTDVAAHQQMVSLYQSLKRQAMDGNVPFPSSIQVATRAYQGGLFLLSQRAFEDAWLDGSFTASDQSLIQQYTAAIFNQAYHLVTEGHGETYEQGLELLATCYTVDTTYRVGSGACWGELRHQLGPDESSWPQPLKTPLLSENS